MGIRLLISLTYICLVGLSWGKPVIDFPDTRSNCILNDFLLDVEGYRLEGYVPKDKYGNVLDDSGVTIGKGVDLGGKDWSYFDNIGVCDDVIEELEPYFGYKGSAAVAKLRRDPLTLTDDQAKYLSTLVTIENIDSVESDYNDAIDSDMLRFNQLTDAQKTVIASVKFQYGDPPSKTPRFWGYVTDQDWRAAIAELRDFGDKYSTRRNKEADLLENDNGSRGECDSDLDTSLECP